MKKRLLCVGICYALTMVVLQHFFPAYYGWMTLGVLALDLGACYVRGQIWKRRIEAAMAQALLEDEMGLEDDESYN